MNREFILALSFASFLVAITAFLLLSGRGVRGEAYRTLELRQVETTQQAGTAVHFGNPLRDHSLFE